MPLNILALQDTHPYTRKRLPMWHQYQCQCQPGTCILVLCCWHVGWIYGCYCSKNNKHTSAVYLSGCILADASLATHLWQRTSADAPQRTHLSGRPPRSHLSGRTQWTHLCGRTSMDVYHRAVRCIKAIIILAAGMLANGSVSKQLWQVVPLLSSPTCLITSHDTIMRSHAGHLPSLINMWDSKMYDTRRSDISNS